jgi:lipid A 4'-phosphatase
MASSSLTASSTADATRRDRRREIAWLSGLAVVVTLAFAATPLDIVAARLFYRPGALDRWPLARELPWSVLYRLAPWITASLVIGGLAALALGLAPGRGAWRRHGTFLLLSVAVGPGLLVNLVLKDHWDRPRPRDIMEFGGPLHYRPAPLPGGEGGASFPCGHCSVGFLYAAGWWVWKRRRPAWARASLAVGLVAGLALGLGRMAAGGHFLSDVIWSALLALGVAHVLYYDLLRLPAHELRESEAVSAGTPAATPAARWHPLAAAAAALGGAVVLLALFATPHGTELTANIPLSSLPRAPRAFEITARTANVEIVVVDAPATELSVTGELHGFGLPTSRLETHVDFDLKPVPTLRYRIEQHGWFTDLDGAALARVPVGELERIGVHLGRGNIRVTDSTREHVVERGRLKLDLRTSAGHVQAPRRSPNLRSAPRQAAGAAGSADLCGGGLFAGEDPLVDGGERDLAADRREREPLLQPVGRVKEPVSIRLAREPFHLDPFLRDEDDLGERRDRPVVGELLAAIVPFGRGRENLDDRNRVQEGIDLGVGELGLAADDDHVRVGIEAG